MYRKQIVANGYWNFRGYLWARKNKGKINIHVLESYIITKYDNFYSDCLQIGLYDVILLFL